MLSAAYQRSSQATQKVSDSSRLLLLEAELVTMSQTSGCWGHPVWLPLLGTRCWNNAAASVLL